MTALAILLFLIFMNGLFVMAEIALVSARKTRLEDMAEKGDQKAKSALGLAENPELFLSTAQIGITLVAILTGLYSGEKFSADLKPYIVKIEPLKQYAATISTALIVFGVTLLSIIFGELIPKRIGLLRAERIARLVAGPMRWLSRICYPIVYLLNGASNLFFALFPISPSKESNVTEEEIKAIISEGTEQGTIEEAEQEIIERVFHLGDRNITSLMTHRSDIVWFDLNDTTQKVRERIILEPHSIYPVCDGNIDNVKGVITIKSIYIAEPSTPFQKLMQPALYVPENNTAYQILEKFKQSKTHSCYIVDEYGSVLGIITLNDILEAIVGDMPEPHMTDYEIVKREDGTFLIDGQIPFYDFLTYFDKTNWISEDDQEFDTLAGFILHQLEHIPHTGEKIHWRGFEFEIVDMDAQRIDKILVTPSKDAATSPSDE